VRAWLLKLTRQVSQHCLAAFFGLSEGFKGRAADLNGASVLIDRAPRSQGARESRARLRLSKLITNEKPLLLAFHICMSSTGLMTHLNCMLHPAITPPAGRRHQFAESEHATR
jgi:hypothetical protein